MTVGWESDSDAVRIANVVAAGGTYPGFALVNLSSGTGLTAETLEEVRDAAYSREGKAAAYIHGHMAMSIGAGLLRRGPQVAEPDTRLASRDDLLSFAASVYPGITDRVLKQRVVPLWNSIGRAAAFVEIARDWQTILPVLDEQPRFVEMGSDSYTPAQLARIARLPLRLVLPHDHEATGTTALSVDLDSLHATLDTILADGYRKASRHFWQLGTKGLDLLARFAMDRVPDLGPLPTLPTRE